MANPATATGCALESLGGMVSTDVDVFRIGGSYCNQSIPTAKLTTEADDVRMCLFVVCGTGKTGIDACSGDLNAANDAPVSSFLPQGARGCCRVGAGSLSTSANCDSQYSTATLSPPTWTAFVVVDRVRDPDCIRYQVDYHF